MNPKVATSMTPCYFPARYVLSLLAFWGMSLEFAHRVCLSVTIVAMVNHTASSTTNGTRRGSLPVCTALSSAGGYNTTDELYQTGKFTWSPAIQGVILGAYFYGFVCTQMIGGRLAELFGGKWLLGLSILSASLLTLATPKAAEMGVATIVVLRVSMGLAHGVCLPSVFAMFSRWAPEGEKNTMIALCLVGDHVGTVLSMPLAGYLCDKGFAGGWPSVFYILGALGCVWFVFWSCLAYSLPSQHPRISEDELDLIKKGKLSSNQTSPVPWTKMLTSTPVWSIAIVSFAASWGQTTLLTKLPAYLENVLNVPIKKNGLMNSLVYVSSCITLFLSGYVSDVLRSKKKSSPTTVRKTFQLFAMLGPAICTAMIPHVECNRTAAISLLTLAMALLGLCGGGHVSIVTDIAPQHAGTIFGFVNSMGCSAGILSPLAAGLILENGDRFERWSLVFYISAALYVVGAIVFTIWASAEMQPWASTSNNGDGGSAKQKLTEESHVINCSFEKPSVKYGTLP